MKSRRSSRKKDLVSPTLDLTSELGYGLFYQPFIGMGETPEEEELRENSFSSPYGLFISSQDTILQ